MKILVIAAHPDDEVLGVGGAINKYIREGNDVYVYIVTDGSTTQYKGDLLKKEKKNENIQEVKKILNLTEIIHGNLPDMKLDTIPHLEINKKISAIVQNIKPEIIFTHHFGDVNKDHQIVYESTMVACRPTSEFIKEIYTYEVLSATEWGTNYSFIPNVYIELTSEDLLKKISALNAYETETRKYPHPRSPEAIENLAKIRGNTILSNYAEAFHLVRKIERKK